MSEAAQAIAEEAIAESNTQPPDPPEEALRAQSKVPTEYHVLRVISIATPGEPDRYELAAENVKAPGRDAAVRATVVASEKPQTFIAVPSRSMKPITVTIETKTQLKLS